jgi:hypothetical protein
MVGLYGLVYFLLGILFGLVFLLQAVLYNELHVVGAQTRRRWAVGLSLLLLAINLGVVLGAAYALRVAARTDVEVFAVYLAVGD